MAEITLQAETGRTTGSRSSGRLRSTGKVPATVYGLGKDPQSVAVVWRELRAALVTDAGLNATFARTPEPSGHRRSISTPPPGLRSFTLSVSYVTSASTCLPSRSCEKTCACDDDTPAR